MPFLLADKSPHFVKLQYSIATMEDRSTPLFRLLGDIKETLDKLVETISAYQQSEASQGKEQIEAESKVVVRLPSEVAEYYKSEESNRPKSDRRDRLRLGLEIVGVFAAISLAVLTFCTLRTLNGQLGEMHQTTKAVQKANDLVLTQDRRPWVWVEMPSKFRLEVGKPITIPLKVFNYGRSPAWVRMRIYIEGGHGIIERLEDPENALKSVIPDEKGTRKIVLRGDTGDEEFRVESPQRIATIQDLNDLKAGTIEIVAYGRIEYSDLDHPWGALNSSGSQYYSLFCFYGLQDGTASVCPNKEHGYTSWMP